METASPAGTRVAFEHWVRPHVDAMARLSARLAPFADRDDVVQEALTRAWLKWRQYDERRGTPSAWLLAITADQARKAHRRGTGIALPAPPPPGSERFSTEDRLDLEAGLRRLSRRQRLAVDCFYFAGLSLAETAAVMKCSPGTVKSTLSDARRRLRRDLGVTS